MTYMPMTADSLEERLGQPVPDLYVLIAKNEVHGLELSVIAKILGVEESEVKEAVADELYQSVRLLIGTDVNQTHVQIDEGWDALERIHLEHLIKKSQYVSDPEFSLKVAAVANKAQRRLAPKPGSVIDPAQAGGVVQLTLTTRMTERLGAAREREFTQIKQLSLMDGSAKNPTFEEVNKLLAADEGFPTLEERLTPASQSEDATEADFHQAMLEEYARGKQR